LSSQALDNLSGLRGFLEDLIAPSVSRLEVRVDTLGKRCDELSSEIKDLRDAHHRFVAYMGDQLAVLNSRIGHLEGRSDGLKSELTATLQFEILKASQRGNSFAPSRPAALPPAGDPASE
jgi:hypothetical protein